MKKTSAICIVATGVCLVHLTASRDQPQSPAPERPAFEVASVKLHRPDPGPLRSSTEVGPAGVTYTNVLLRGCIRTAYGVESYRIVGGPDWFASERYDIVAKAASAAPKAQLMRMLQTLLEERFKLRVHRETQDIPIYALVVRKNGLKLHAGKEDGDTEVGGAAHLIDSRGMTMKFLAGVLSQSTQRLGQPVLDMTGLTGVFDITLDFAPDDAAAASDNAAPDLFTALRGLGLTLEPRKSPMEVIVVDHAERPSGN
jgi:uncharacterized protein (TIGR03435 family)